jgi:hypothetical protein
MKKSMQKIVILVTSLVVLIGLGIGALMLFTYYDSFSEEEYTFGATLQYRVVNGEVVIRNYNGRIGVDTLIIPAEIRGLPVTRIEDFGVASNEELRFITIGKNVREIAPFAFANNRNMLEYRISNEGNDWFMSIDGVLYERDEKGNPTALVVFPTGQSRVGRVTEGFAEPVRTLDFTVPDGVEAIRDLAFYKNWWIESVILPDSLRVIGVGAFMYNESLSEINLPFGLTTIEQDAFKHTRRLSKVHIPSTVTYVGPWAWYNANGLVDPPIVYGTPAYDAAVAAGEPFIYRDFFVDVPREQIAQWDPRWNHRADRNVLPDIRYAYPELPTIDTPSNLTDWLPLPIIIGVWAVAGVVIWYFERKRKTNES